MSARMRIENVRGKEYSKTNHAVTVRPRADKKGNDLYIINTREDQAMPIEFEDRRKKD
jgi:hypothetical protein